LYTSTQAIKEFAKEHKDDEKLDVKQMVIDVRQFKRSAEFESWSVEYRRLLIAVLSASIEAESVPSEQSRLVSRIAEMEEVMKEKAVEEAMAKASSVAQKRRSSGAGSSSSSAKKPKKK